MTTFNVFSHTFFASNAGAAPEKGAMRELTTAELASVSGGLLDYRSPYLQDNWPFTQFGAPDGPPPGEGPGSDDRLPDDLEDMRDRVDALEREQELDDYVGGCTTGFTGVGAILGGLIGGLGLGGGAIPGALGGATVGGVVGGAVCPNDGNAREIKEAS